MRYTGIFIFLCSYILTWEFWAAGHALLPHVLRYEVVQLQAVQRRIKRSESPQQKYPAELEYTLAIDGKNVTVYLEKNRELLGKDYTLTDYTKDGPKEINSFNMDHCYYQGHIRKIKDSSVSVALCSGMRGFFKAKNQVYLIEPLEDSVKGDHAVYKQEHLRTKRAAVGYINDTVYNIGPRLAGLHKNRKMALTSTQRFVEMILVVDHKEYTQFGSLKSVEKRMLEVANHVDKLYRPLNIRVTLVGLEVWSYQDQIIVSPMPNLTLDRFLKWRQTNLLPRKKHDNAQFVTAENFKGSTVGLAPLYSMCSPSSGAVNEDHTTSPFGVASTIAHEMGHNLGMSHDDPALHCVCSKTSSDQNCVMRESIGVVVPEAFSSCSKAALEAFLQNYDTRCLLNVPNVDELYGGPECGNGFVEKGEECDCGTLQECKNSCCNATTCRLTEGSQCAHGECCDSCQLKEVGSLCRPRAHDCDLEEYCSGTSAHCPKDYYKMNGIPCNSKQGYCYNGQCPTHKEHCKMLWGQDADVDDACFNNNDIHCKRPGFYGCSQQDYKCGKIYCSGGNVYPITKEVGRIYINNRMCKLAVDNSGTEDIGMVPTGTKCGTNKVCYKSLCQDINIYETKNCSAKCNSHGVCNHEKQCHCEPGWAPPYCEVKLSVLHSRKNDVIISVIVTIVILLLITLITGAFVFYKQRKTNKKKRYLKDMNTYPGQCNPGFQPGSVKSSPKCGPPRISQPVFLESSTTQDCRPLFPTVTPSRPAPQILKPSSLPSVVSNSINFTEGKSFLSSTPLPPSRPLPPLMNKPINKPKPPPVPPVKPSGIIHTWNSPQVSSVPKVPLKPPPKYR